MEEVIIYRGHEWRSRLLHDDRFHVESVRTKRPMLGGRARGSAHGARGPVQRP